MTIALKNLVSETGRLVTSLIGVAFASLLVLVMSGIYIGTIGQVTTYIDNTPASVWVAQPGVTQMFRSVSWLPADTARSVAAVDGVTSASPLLGVPSSFDHDGSHTAYYLVGYDLGAAGGPWELTEGRPIRSGGETVMDAVLAAKNDVGVGDVVRLVDRDFTVVGLSDETAAVGNFYAFVTLADAAQLLRASGRISYVLATAATGLAPETLAQRIEEQVPTVDALTASEFADNSRSIVISMVGRPLLAMILIGLLVGIALISLTVLSMTQEQMRDFGVLRAIGVRPGQLVVTVVVQALVLAVVGYVIGAGATFGVRSLIKGRLGDVTVSVPPWLLAAMAATTLLMAILGSLLPVRRVSALDPALAFRR
ncbi:MAG: FtsX-like permease family protein [Kineosporiaceae bacterium]|nr:FtsX-like permease family protein [Kineosporiaceae bacterium]